MRATLESLTKPKPFELQTDVGELLVLPITSQQLKKNLSWIDRGAKPEVLDEASQLLSELVVDDNGCNWLTPDQAARVPQYLQNIIIEFSMSCGSKKKMVSQD